LSSWFKKNGDVIGAGWVKDADGAIVVEDKTVMEIWKRYYEKIMNEEFNWDKLVQLGGCKSCSRSM